MGVVKKSNVLLQVAIHMPNNCLTKVCSRFVEEGAGINEWR